MSIMQSLKNLLYNRYRYWKIRQRIPNQQYARFVQQNWIDDSMLEWDQEKKGLRIKGFDLVVRQEKNAFLLTPFNQVPEMVLLEKELKAKFFEQDGELYIRFDELVLNIQTREELLIVREVYLEGVYQYIPQREFIVLDIGMNVGFSSLYFARYPQCSQVYSFEPFKPTYQQALKNIDNNPALKGKIKTFNYGVSDSNGSFEIDYSPSNRGSMSVDYWPDYATDLSDVRKESIRVRDVKEIFDEIGIGDHNSQVIAKIDCEGAEYGILDRLTSTGLLKNIDIVMMEWHLKGADPLVKNLNAAGFECFNLRPFDKYQGKYGFIYAVRK